MAPTPSPLFVVAVTERQWKPSQSGQSQLVSRLIFEMKTKLDGLGGSGLTISM